MKIKGLRHLAFAVDDVAAWIEFLRSKSGEVQDIRIDEITQKKFTFFLTQTASRLSCMKGS